MSGRRTDRYRRLRWVAALMAMGPLVAACSQDGGGTTGSSTAPPPVRVAFFAPLANTYVEATIKGMQEVADQRGATITKFDTGFDASKQFSQVQDAVTQSKFDAFIIIPLDSVGLVPAVEEAIKAGIKVVNTDLVLGPASDTSTPQVQSQAGSVVNPPKDRASRMIEGIVAACKDLNPCNVGFMAGEPSIDFEQEVKKRLDSLPAAQPNIKIKAYQAGHGYVAAKAIPIAQNMLQANPDLNVLSSSSDQASAGAEEAIKDAGKAGKIRLVSSGGSCPAVEAVKAGRWFATVIDLPRTEGRLGMEIAIDAVRGVLKDPKGVNPMDTLKRDPFVTKENAEGFECEWQG